MNALALALLVAASAPEELDQKYTLAFRPTPGKSLEKDYEHAFELGPHWREPFVREERRTVLTDRYVSVADGAVTEFVRRFDRVTLEGRGESPLQAESVRFTRDPESGEHEAAFVEPDGARARGIEAESLASLRFDADATGFLPGAPVAVDDEWRVPAAAVLAVLTPGGTYEYRLEQPGPLDFSNPESVHCATEHLSEENPSGLRARLKEITLFGADRIAVVAIEGELLFEVDFVGPVHVLPRKRGFFPVYSLPIPRRALLRYEFEGTLRWNIDSHHLDEMHLSADVVLQENRTSMEAAVEAVDAWIGSSRFMSLSDWSDWYDLDLDSWFPDGSLPVGELRVSVRVFC